MKRAIATAAADSDTALASELEREYEYDGVQTCAVDGMCQTACPVRIDTGDLVRRLRTSERDSVKKKVWDLAAAHWGATTRVGSIVLSAASLVPAPLVTATNKLARALVGKEALPLWSPDLPKGSRRRARLAPANEPEAVYMPACVNSMFGAVGDGVQESFEKLSQRAGITLLVPTEIDSLCCGTPWSSKGLPGGVAIMRDKVLTSLRAATRNGVLPIVCDASSCTEGLVHMIEADTEEPQMQVIDVVDFVASRILPILPAQNRTGKLALHPTCSSTRLGINPQLKYLAEAVAETVIVPDSWGCCAFAGDRGMLYPELTESATREQAAEINDSGATAFASCNRTCELGMTRATGAQYKHVLELLEETTRF